MTGAYLVGVYSPVLHRKRTEFSVLEIQHFTPWTVAEIKILGDN